MSNIVNFSFHTKQVRVVELEGNPWFVAADVLRALDFDTTQGTSKHYTKLSDDEKSKGSRTAIGMAPGKPVMLISESGLYKLVMRSDKPKAMQFRGWVTRDLLPAIRKDGACVMDEEKRRQAIELLKARAGSTC